MQLKSLVFTCAASVLFVLASVSYGADTPVAATANPAPEAAANPTPPAAANAPADAAAKPPAEAAVNPPAKAATKPPAKAAMENPRAIPVVNDPTSVYRVRDNPFFGLHIDKSIEHARDAEMAGKVGLTAELFEHIQLSLMQAREAQRAGNLVGLNEGIANLREALKRLISVKEAQMQASPSSAEGTDPRCIDELQRQCGEVQPGGGRIQKCFDDKIDNFSPMCQQKLKENKSAIAAAIMSDRHQRELAASSPSSPDASAVREATDLVRKARQNLHQAAGRAPLPVEQFENVAMERDEIEKNP